MENFQSHRWGCGEPGENGVANEAVAANDGADAERTDSGEGDIIRGLGIGLVFSVLIWTVLLTLFAVAFG